MSIRYYLVLVLLSSIILVCFSASISGYKASMSEADKVFDEQLKSISLAMINVEGKLETKKRHQESNFAVQLWHKNSLYLNLLPDPSIRTPLGDFTVGFSTVNFSNQRWRLYTNHDVGSDRWIFVAQPIKYRFKLAENMILSAVTPLILSMPFLALLISFTIKNSLKPLVKLSRQLKTKQADDFAPIETLKESNELSPVIDTLNSLLQRVENAFLREKYFASDAAHELRNPLNGLNIAIHNLGIKMGNSNDLIAIQNGVQRMSHIVEQILMLNRTHPDHLVKTFTPISLTQTVQSVVMDLYPQIESKNQEISLESNDVYILAEQFTLKTLLQNLVGNAIKYTPDNGKISIQTELFNKEVVLLIQDSGPGISENDYERVFDRFYRSGGDQHKSKVIGCGLGLAIVKHIIEVYNATIELSRSEMGGLTVKVKFLACDDKGIS